MSEHNPRLRKSMPALRRLADYILNGKGDGPTVRAAVDEVVRNTAPAGSLSPREWENKAVENFIAAWLHEYLGDDMPNVDDLNGLGEMMRRNGYLPNDT